MPGTTAADVLAILDDLASAGADPIVAGGWGVDGLIGDQGRDHADLDVAIDTWSKAAAVEVLAASGYRITTDSRPFRIALAHPDGSEVDLHPVASCDDGTRIQEGFDRQTFGYVPQDEDVSDCRRLAARTGADLPAGTEPEQ